MATSITGLWLLAKEEKEGRREREREDGMGWGPVSGKKGIKRRRRKSKKESHHQGGVRIGSKRIRRSQLNRNLPILWRHLGSNSSHFIIWTTLVKLLNDSKQEGNALYRPLAICFLYRLNMAECLMVYKYLRRGIICSISHCLIIKYYMLIFPKLSSAAQILLFHPINSYYLVFSWNFFSFRYRV